MYAIKVEFKLNNKERTKMAQHAGFSRFIYNYGLSLMRQLDHKEFKGSSSKKIDEIQKTFTNFTKKQPEFAWTKKLSSRVYQTGFRSLKDAYSRWHKGLGETPQFKRKRNRRSFTIVNSNGKVVLEVSKRIKIPTLGTFRLKQSLPCRYVTGTFTVSETAGRWFVSFSVNAEKIPPLTHEVAAPVGVDLGVKCFATCSDGSKYVAPQPYQKAKTKLGKQQWRNRNKALGNRKQGIKASNNAKKHYAKLAKTHAHIANIRKDFLHKTTTELAKKYAVIHIEDLNVAGMIANHKLASAISDLGFYEFRRQLGYKQKHYGNKVMLVDRWYPSSKTCHNCGNIQPMPLSERTYKCGECGQTADRDLNAAQNLASVSIDKLKSLEP
ncbi:MAG: IS200/IS605 family element transposase accessory protein TnpB [Symploca sp. SIO1C4]|uniref:IS200/IS605 family element transposase accessory protein TnpB n=1 Tax=Symploca sp. SIO1C4 TaxID=2607765 RepID=A0A6B3NB07_9CYAN|nr:IS200/IS605 family element transposase accessory protein TnpB [Symploca sp. SIO1C4]